MATFSFFFLIFHLLTLYPISCLSLETLTTVNNPNFDLPIALLGDVRTGDNDSLVRLTIPNPSSSGLLLYKEPFKFFDSNVSKTSSFSTEFVFSFTGTPGVLSLVMGPHNFESKFLGQAPFNVSEEKGYLGIKFGASIESGLRFSRTCIISVTVDNEPPTNLTVKNDNGKMKSWIDYDASSKRLEIRIGRINETRPYDPIIAYSIDLFKMWGDNDVYVGLGSRYAGGNVWYSCFVYSWKFKLRKIPYWMHSMPVDPNAFKNNNSNENVTSQRKKFCPLTVLAGMIFATGCVALVSFMVLFMCSIFTNSHTVFPIEKGDVKPVDFRYEKICLVVEKDEKVVEN